MRTKLKTPSWREPGFTKQLSARVVRRARIQFFLVVALLPGSSCSTSTAAACSASTSRSASRRSSRSSPSAGRFARDAGRWLHPVLFRRLDPGTAGATLFLSASRRSSWRCSSRSASPGCRDTRWLLEIASGGKGEKFFDCGESRDGTGYKNVTDSTDSEVKAAREKFAQIVATIPEPKAQADAGGTRKKKQAADQ